jgi:hypothetical protein
MKQFDAAGNVVKSCLGEDGSIALAAFLPANRVDKAGT